MQPFYDRRRIFAGVVGAILEKIYTFPYFKKLFPQSAVFKYKKTGTNTGKLEIKSDGENNSINKLKSQFVNNNVNSNYYGRTFYVYYDYELSGGSPKPTSGSDYSTDKSNGIYFNGEKYTIVQMSVGGTNVYYTYDYEQDGKYYSYYTERVANYPEKFNINSRQSDSISVEILDGVTALDGYATYSSSMYCNKEITESIDSWRDFNGTLSPTRSLTKFYTPFYNFNDISSLKIPASVDFIDVDKTFYGLFDIFGLDINCNLRGINTTGFSNCHSLTVVVSNSKFKSSNNTIYSKDGKTLIYSLPTSSEIQNISSTVERIGRLAFAYRPGIANLSFSSNIKYIDYCAFAGNSSLRTLTLDKNILPDSIGDFAFIGCPIENLIMNCDSKYHWGNYSYGMLPTVDSNSRNYFINYPFIFYDSSKLYYYGDVVKYGTSFYRCRYTTTGTWDSDDWVKLSYNSPIEFDSNISFYGNRGKNDKRQITSTTLVNLTVGTNDENTNGATIIQENVFNACRGLNNVNIGGFVTKVGRGAFFYCYNLNTIDFNGEIGVIHNKVFDTTVDTKNALYIDEYAFYFCPYIGLESDNKKRFVLGNRVKTVRCGAFANCSQFEKFTFGTGLKNTVYDNTLLTSNTNYFNAGCVQIFYGSEIKTLSLNSDVIFKIGNRGYTSHTHLWNCETSIWSSLETLICNELTGSSLTMITPDSFRSYPTSTGSIFGYISLTGYESEESGTYNNAFNKLSNLYFGGLNPKKYTNFQAVGERSFSRCPLKIIDTGNSDYVVYFGASNSRNKFSLFSTVKNDIEHIYLRSKVYISGNVMSKSIKNLYYYNDVIDRGFSHSTGYYTPYLNKYIANGGNIYFGENCKFICGNAFRIGSSYIPSGRSMNFKFDSGFDRIRYIGDSAFSRNPYLTNNNMGMSGFGKSKIMSVGVESFYLTTGYDTITMSINFVESSAFARSSVKHLVLNDVVRIGSGAFSGCTQLETVTINFADASTLDSFGMRNDKYIPECQEIFPGIDGSAFSGCSALKSVTIGGVCCYIGNKAFYNCTSLSSYSCSKVYWYGESVFENCTSLDSIIFGDAYFIGHNVIYNTGYYNNKDNWRIFKPTRKKGIPIDIHDYSSFIEDYDGSGSKYYQFAMTDYYGSTSNPTTYRRKKFKNFSGVQGEEVQNNGYYYIPGDEHGQKSSVSTWGYDYIYYVYKTVDTLEDADLKEDITCRLLICDDFLVYYDKFMFKGEVIDEDNMPDVLKRLGDIEVKTDVCFSFYAGSGWDLGGPEIANYRTSTDGISWSGWEPSWYGWYARPSFLWVKTIPSFDYDVSIDLSEDFGFTKFGYDVNCNTPQYSYNNFRDYSLICGSQSNFHITYPTGLESTYNVSSNSRLKMYMTLNTIAIPIPVSFSKSVASNEKAPELVDVGNSLKYIGGLPGVYLTNCLRNSELFYLNCSGSMYWYANAKGTPYSSSVEYYKYDSSSSPVPYVLTPLTGYSDGDILPDEPYPGGYSAYVCKYDYSGGIDSRGYFYYNNILVSRVASSEYESLQTSITVPALYNFGANLVSSRVQSATLNCNIVEPGMFSGKTQLTSLSMGGVSQVCNSAFQGCSSLVSVNTSGVKYFGDYSFYTANDSVRYTNFKVDCTNISNARYMGVSVFRVSDIANITANNMPLSNTNMFVMPSKLKYAKCNLGLGGSNISYVPQTIPSSATLYFDYSNINKDLIIYLEYFIDISYVSNRYIYYKFLNRQTYRDVINYDIPIFTNLVNSQGYYSDIAGCIEYVNDIEYEPGYTPPNSP